MGDYGLSDYDASVLTTDLEAAHYFEDVVRPRATANSPPTGSSTSSSAGSRRKSIPSRSPVTPAQLGAIITLIKSGDISGKIAKDLFEIVYTEGGDPAEIVEARGLKQVTDTGAIETAVDEIIAANPAQVEKAKQNPKLAGWFVGQVMKATGGKANPKAVNEIVSAKLGL
jgi:aspartyl-tRNA(Asn)/glutamyl-tRNA(Gln) amidotransferase subunit B